MRCESKAQVQRRLKRVAGQVAGLQKMVDEDRYCIDVLTQLSAARAALDAIGIVLLTDHIEGCVVGHGTGSEHPCATKMEPEELVEEVRVSLKRFLA
ncbi:metal-sensitive transcriptional regulator [Candidatus Laterigemmans baculatus]|uniref:metal-sensitive transcriptional regulator n=1 Tax=Candidatus Laterigemmans baculatus TaxID=2770505 RepID=UPI0013DC197D|nr:metal-sensitive transcriptional regulator [Candidatus Laterigemmans baculatus]